MKKVILESPYTGIPKNDWIKRRKFPVYNIVKWFLTKRNIRYARMCIRDSLSRGESPIASHLLYTQKGILNDNIPVERKQGIDAGLAWKNDAETHVFYIDHGISNGMKYGMKYATENNIPVEYRELYKK